jgi:stalled ribosome rescue protein Dom34
LLEFLRRVVPSVEPLIKSRPAPIILAAHPEIQGHFREVAGWKDIYPRALSENPDAFTSEELHRRTYGILEQQRIEARNATLDRLNARLGTGRATTTPEEVVKAARHGRVDTLFLTGSDHLWGKIESDDRLVAHGSAAEDDFDLLNYAALMTLRQGGSVMLVDRTQLPAPRLSAAILRY